MKVTYQVYILQNLVGRYYIGVTEKVAVRLIQPNAGKSQWTAKHRPWVLVWQSEASNLAAARRLEILLKRQKGGQGFTNIPD